tara:strand:- start:7284 stop:7445 length:162 start_codon:yes stop_codon:yes gene_type:complete
MASRIIYLASPYGFSAHWKQKLLPDLIFILESLGACVWEPFERNSDVDLSASG